MQPPSEAEDTDATEATEDSEDTEDSFFRQLTALSSNRLGGNPFYSQEEFTYNQVNIYILYHMHHIFICLLSIDLSTPRTRS